MGDNNPKFSDPTVMSLIQLGRETAGPTTVQVLPGNPVPFIVHQGKVVPAPDLVFNEHSEHPERIKASITVVDPESFIAYYQLFSDPNSRVFADESKISVAAVLDYHAAGEGNAPRWCQHRVTLTLRQSEEWRRWLDKNNVKLSQQDFAEFLEQNAVDIGTPDPATMMEVARDLQASTEMEFGSSINRANGQARFKYTETTKASVGAGQLAVPEQFTLSIPAFIGGQRVLLQALLRFRVAEGKLVIWYTLVRTEEVIRTAFLAARGQIAEALKVEIINGTA